MKKLFPVDTNNREEIIYFLVKYIVKYPNLAQRENIDSVVREIFDNSIAGKYTCLEPYDIRELRALPKYSIDGFIRGRYFFNEDGLIEYRTFSSLRR